MGMESGNGDGIGAGKNGDGIGDWNLGLEMGIVTGLVGNKGTVAATCFAQERGAGVEWGTGRTRVRMRVSGG